MQQDDTTVRNADAMAPVTQADRANAYALMIKIGRVSPLYHDAIMRGEWDEASDEIQAFASHRLSSPADGATGVDLRAAVIEECARVADGWAANGTHARNVGQSIAYAIRSLTPTGTGEQGK